MYALLDTMNESTSGKKKNEINYRIKNKKVRLIYNAASNTTKFVAQIQLNFDIFVKKFTKPPITINYKRSEEFKKIKK